MKIVNKLKKPVTLELIYESIVILNTKVDNLDQRVKYIEENFVTKKYLEENFATKKYIDENFATKRYINDNFATKKYIDENFATKRYINDNFATKKYLDENFVTKKYLDDNYVNKVGLQKMFQSELRPVYDELRLTREYMISAIQNIQDQANLNMKHNLDLFLEKFQDEMRFYKEIFNDHKDKLINYDKRIKKLELITSK